MAKESTQKKLSRVRPPRVHITYDVHIGDAIEMKELPFVMGILSDLSGNPEEALPRLRDRKFVEIDRDNFNAAMKGMKPRLAFKVENKLAADDSEWAWNCASITSRRLRARASGQSSGTAEKTPGCSSPSFGLAGKNRWQRQVERSSSGDRQQHRVAATGEQRNRC